MIISVGADYSTPICHLKKSSQIQNRKKSLIQQKLCRTSQRLYFSSNVKDWVFPLELGNTQRHHPFPCISLWFKYAHIQALKTNFCCFGRQHTGKISKSKTVVKEWRGLCVSVAYKVCGSQKWGVFMQALKGGYAGIVQKCVDIWKVSKRLRLRTQRNFQRRRFKWESFCA